jgi:hypothetical protein
LFAGLASARLVETVYERESAVRLQRSRVDADLLAVHDAWKLDLRLLQHGRHPSKPKASAIDRKGMALCGLMF